MKKELFVDPALFVKRIIDNFYKATGKKKMSRLSEILPELHELNIVFAITKLVNSNDADEITRQLVQDHLYIAPPEIIKKIVVVYLPKLIKAGKVSSDGIPVQKSREIASSYACFLEDIEII